MKKNLLTMLALVSGILLMAGSSIQAQSARATRASIPFEFAVTNATLPAGDYTIQNVNAGTLIMRGADLKSQAFVPATQRIKNIQPAGSMRLVFHRYGSSYFLSEVWTSASSGVRLAPSKQERAVAKELAKLNERAQSIEIAVAR